MQPHSPIAPQPVRDYGRILLGLIVLTIGALLLLDSAGVLDGGRAISHYWPAAIIAVALFQFAEGNHGLLRPAFVLAAGSLLLLVTAHVISGNAWDYVWPTAIIAAGVFIISRWRGASIPEPLRSDDAIVATGIFGGPTIASSSQSFRGASLTAVFGGVSLDLRSAKPAPEGAAISATAAFGGVEILVPQGWKIVVKATPIFGGVDDKTRHEEVADDAPTLQVDGLALFGGIEIKHNE